jgi:ABC-type Na+ transport system ATPase subunit NatA
MIGIRGLRKKFSAVEAVRDVTFSAADGTVVGLQGPNGAGKTVRC